MRNISEARRTCVLTSSSNEFKFWEMSYDEETLKDLLIRMTIKNKANHPYGEPEIISKREMAKKQLQAKNKRLKGYDEISVQPEGVFHFQIQEIKDGENRGKVLVSPVCSEYDEFGKSIIDFMCAPSKLRPLFSHKTSPNYKKVMACIKKTEHSSFSRHDDSCAFGFLFPGLNWYDRRKPMEEFKKECEICSSEELREFKKIKMERQKNKIKKVQIYN